MTHRFATSTAIVIAALALSGCDWFKSVSGSADTEMKNVEILPGTASDEMITLDSASGDGTAIDTSVDVAPVVPGTENENADDAGDSTAADSPDTPASSEDEPETRPGDVVIRPPAPRTEPPAPVKK